MTLKEWGSLVTLLKTIYQREEKFIPDAETARAWFPLVEDMDFEKARQAVNRYIKEERFAPTIADIRLRYDDIVSEEKHKLGQVREQFQYMRSYYPGSGDVNTGWNEFFSLCGDSVEKAAWLRNKVTDMVNGTKNRWLPPLPITLKSINPKTGEMPAELMDLVEEKSGEVTEEECRRYFRDERV